MPGPDDVITRADLETLVGVAELREMLSRGRPRTVHRSYAEQVMASRSFPPALIVYPRVGRIHVRLWLLADVEDWMDRYRPGWRHLPAAPED